VQRRPGPLGLMIAPDPAEQPIDRHDPVDVDQQRHQDAPLARVPELERPIPHPGINRPQHAKLDRHARRFFRQGTTLTSVLSAIRAGGGTRAGVSVVLGTGAAEVGLSVGRRAALQELVDVLGVDAREGARRQGGQQM
jgi:hypothetical protein